MSDITSGRNPSVDADPDRLADLAILAVSCDAFNKYIQSTGKVGHDAHLKKGMMLFRKYIGALEASLQQYIEPILEHATRFRPLYNRALTGSAADKVAHSAELFSELFRWMKSHPDIAKGIFNGRGLRAAQKLMLLVVEDTPQAILNKAAAIPSVSGLNISRKWIEESAKLAEVPISPVESVLADAETAQAVGDKIKDVQTRLSVSDPLTEEGASLQEERKEHIRQVEEIAQESKAPAVVLTSVVTNLAKEPESKEAEKFGLDDQQKSAMLASGRSVIAAAAGSGKTRTVIAKMSYLVHEKNIRPDQILATTFTRKAKDEMAERAEKFGIHGAEVKTTHSIAGGIVKQHGTQQDKDAISRGTDICRKLWNIAIAQIQLKGSATASDKTAWNPAWKNRGNYRPQYQQKSQTPTNMNQLYKQPVNQWFNMGIKLKDEKGNKVIGNKMLETAVGNFSNRGMKADEAKNKYVTPDQKDTIDYIAAVAYGAYDWLKKNNPEGLAYDFNDWLNRANEIIKTDPKARVMEQSKYKAVLIDEAQDLNQVQHELFGALSEKADDVTYIGDPNQAIYSWRGAAPKEFSGLANKGYKVMPISTSFRCGEKILDAANKLIANNEADPLRFPTKPTTKNIGQGNITARIVSDHETAAETTADEIKASLEEAKASMAAGVEQDKIASPKDFGILVRNNGERDAYQAALIAREIPYRSKSNYFANPKVKGLTNWMTLAAIGTGSSDAEINEAVLTAHESPGFFLGKEFTRALESTCPKGMNYYDHLKKNLDQITQAAYPTQQFRGKSIQAYVDAIDDLINFSKDEKTSAKDIMTKIIDLKGVAKDADGSTISFMDKLVDDVDIDDVNEEGEKPTAEDIKAKALAPLRPMMKMAEHQQDPTKCLAYIRKMKVANDRNAKKEDSPEPAVQIDTVHQWKGLETKHVYVSMASGTFPYYGAKKAYDAGDTKALDEERRLAYVAITRGAESVDILCPQLNYLNKKNQGVSTFVTEAGIPVVGGEGNKTSSVRESSHFGSYLTAALLESEYGKFSTDDDYSTDLFDEE